ncbi:MAG: M12 family metallo-peptidase, partial [Planctomycetota bacterium]
MRNSHLLGAGAAMAALAGLASAQTGLVSASAPQPIDAAFPLTSTDIQIAPGVRVFEPRAVEIEALSRANSVLMRALPTAAGGPVDVQLERIPIERMQFGFQVDGEPAPGLIDGLDLSVWTGEVVGQPESEVVLSFSNRGVRGWIADGAELTHLLAEPDEQGDWNASRTLVVGDTQLRSLGVENSFRCGSGELAREATPSGKLPQAAASYAGGGTILRECSLAIETDYQLNQVFGGDLTAEAAHITSLLAAGSQRYIEQIGTVLTYPYIQFYTTPDDPWSTPDNGGGSIDMLNEFVGAWEGNVPDGAIVGHMLSGANLGGGVAYLNGICDTSQTTSFAVSGNLDGQTPFPITVGPFNWEFIVFTHETGHNFGSPHTHSYCPPVDQCSSGCQGSGPCQQGT